jgi:hypothetical protein
MGRLQASKVGGRYTIDELDLDAAQGDDSELPLPPEWRRMADGRPMPNVVLAVRRSRMGH